MIVFGVLWIAHARGMRHAGERLRDHRLYAWIATLGVLFVVADHFAGRGGRLDGGALFRRARHSPASEWHDPVFHRALGFYFFDLPLYSMLINFRRGDRAGRGAGLLSGGARLADPARISRAGVGVAVRFERSAVAGQARIGIAERAADLVFY